MACGSGEVQAPTAEVWDSAGVTIADDIGSLEPADGSWRLAPRPLAQIGALTGPEGTQLFRVSGTSRLADGRIVIGNDGTKELRFFSSDGGFLGTMGGEGEGPGEFASLQLLGQLGDSLVALARRLGRVSLVHPVEGFIRSAPMDDTVAYYPMDGWLFEEGSVLIQDLPLFDEDGMEDGFKRIPVPHKSCDLSGALRVDFGEYPGS
jgi:hypothetical protein